MTFKRDDVIKCVDNKLIGLTQDKEYRVISDGYYNNGVPGRRIWLCQKCTEEISEYIYD